MKKFVLIGAMLSLGSCIAIGPTARINFTAPNTYPEGIAFDKAANVFYVSSARLGTVGKVTPEGGYTKLHEDKGLKSTYGMKVHPDGKRLFVCVSDANYSLYTSDDTRKKMGRLISIDLGSGRKLADVDLAALLPGEKHFINDLAFDAAGNAYVTDSYAGAIYKVSAGGQPSVFSRSKLYETEGVGLNGIVVHPDGYLIVANTAKGAFFKVSLTDGQNVQKIRTDQFYNGADGLLLTEKDILTVCVNNNNDKIFQIKTDDNWTSGAMHATTLIADRFGYPSTATQAGDKVWVMNAKFNEIVDSNSFPSKTFAMQQAVFKPVPKPKSRQ